MSNWSALQEQLIGKPVVKRAKHGIHFDNGDGQILAHFSGAPCHYLDGGIYKPIDTKFLLGADGFYGCPHSPVRVHADGHVKVDGTDYAQFTELPSAQTGLVDGDRIVRPFSFGEQRFWVTEDGFKSEIQLNRIPTLTEARKLIASESGTLSLAYLKSLTTATDANGKVHTYFTLSAFRTWLASAAFPVVIDPDFAAGTSYGYVRGENADFATAKSTSALSSTTALNCGVDVGNKRIYRAFVKFDTSSIGGGATVTQANLKQTVSADASSIDADILIKKYNWSGQDPLAAGNREAAYDGCLAADADDNIWRNTAGMSVNTPYTSGNLSTAWISKTGSTYYGLLSALDSGGSAYPAANAWFLFCTPGDATEAYRPTLTVLYTSGTLLRVNMNAQFQNLSGNMRG